MDAAHAPTESDPAGKASGAASRGLAVWVVLVCGLAAVFLGGPAAWLVREQLHINCSMGAPGSEGADTWTCSDGVGYLAAAVTLGLMWFVVILLGSLVAGIVRHDLTARAILVLLAGGATAWILWWTWYGSSELVVDDYAPMAGTEYWVLAIGPAAIASAVSLLAALVSLALVGRASRIVCAGAAVGLTIATVLQPGLAINTIPAAGMLAAAAVRTTVSSPPGVRTR